MYLNKSINATVNLFATVQETSEHHSFVNFEFG